MKEEVRELLNLINRALGHPKANRYPAVRDPLILARTLAEAILNEAGEEEDQDGATTE